MGYTEEKIIDMCEAEIETPESFYNADMVNYTGTATYSERKYTEIIAEFLMNHLDKLRSIKQITRNKPYYTETHDGNYENDSKIENRLAKRLFKEGGDFPFVIIDYETPLKNEKSKTCIDLLAVNEDEEALYILELKKKTNKEDKKETMLRCVLEAYTYAKLVDKEKLISDFSKANGKHHIDGAKNYKLKIAPLVFVDGAQYNEMKHGNNHWLMMLMTELGKDEKWGEDYIIAPFYIHEEDGKYRITKG